MNINVDIDIDDMLWEMSKREKQNLVDDLYNDGYIPKPFQNKADRYTDDFSHACQKLIGEAWRLTREEEEFIINISKRF
jgi:hypothetical protein